MAPGCLPKKIADIGISELGIDRAGKDQGVIPMELNLSWSDMVALENRGQHRAERRFVQRVEAIQRSRG